MVTFFTAIEAILWCVAVQRELLKHTWPEALLQQPGTAHCRPPRCCTRARA
jgi:hypothetical protein